MPLRLAAGVANANQPGLGQTASEDVPSGCREREIFPYLEAALAEDDPALVAAALGDIARAKGMTKVARETGLGRESLYEALSPDGNPEFTTVMKVARSLGLRRVPRVP